MRESVFADRIDVDANSDQCVLWLGFIKYRLSELTACTDTARCHG